MGLFSSTQAPAVAPRSPASGTVYANTDALFNLGTSTTITANAPQSGGAAGVYSSNGSGQELWVIVPNTYAISTGSGTVNMTYASGVVTTNVNLSGINNSEVSAYPFIGLGSDVFGFHNGDQGPHFPAQLSTISSLIIETQYDLSLSKTNSGNIDVLFDEWLMPTANFSGAQAGSVEVEIIPYFSFAGGYWGTYIKTFTVPIVLNGVSTTMSFLEYAAQAVGSGGGKGPGTDILFYPAVGQGLLTAKIKFDAALFLNEAATTSAVGTGWYVPGVQFGTEFGNTNSIAYTFQVQGLHITQTLK